MTERPTTHRWFTIEAPAGDEVPLVVEIPHAGQQLEPLALATLVVPARSIALDADLYVDDLYADAGRFGATRLIAHASRYVVDLNRAADDIDSRAVVGAPTRSRPHGLIWHQSTSGEAALASPLAQAELLRRVEVFHRPYHEALRRRLEELRAQHGAALLLCAHSMPSAARGARSALAPFRADVVPGTRGRSTASAAVIAAVEEVASDHGLTLRHDDPYRGGWTTAVWGRPREGFHAVQVELSRRLYMDERTLRPDPRGFAKTRVFCADLVATLAKEARRLAAAAREAQPGNWAGGAASAGGTKDDERAGEPGRPADSRATGPGRSGTT